MILKNYKKKYLCVDRNKIRVKIFFFKTLYAVYKKLFKKLKFERNIKINFIIVNDDI